MARLIEIGFSELSPTLRTLSEAGVTTQDADWIRSPGNAALIAEFLHQQVELANKNPFELSVDETLKRFREASEQEG